MSKDLTYSAALSKGTHLLQMLHADDATAGKMMNPAQPSAASQFLDPAALAKWGYTRKHENFSDKGNLVANIASDLLPSPHAATLKSCVFDHHLKDTFHYGRGVPFNEARFISLVSRENNLLVAVANFGPEFKVGKYMVEDRPPIPDLKHWSDVAYLQWIDPGVTAEKGEYKVGEIAELKYVLRHQIQNSDTDGIVEHIFGERGGAEGLLWPGATTFTMDEDHGKALLGTPHGSGVAWLLIQHKEQLGHKAVEKVTVMCKDEEDARTRDDSNLLFYIKDV